MKRERFPHRTVSCALETGKQQANARGGGAGSLQKGCSCSDTRGTPRTSPRLWAAPPRAQALPDKAGTALAALRHPWPVLPAASQLQCVPKPSSGITIRQHPAFCNLMLLYPSLFSWKETKACRFYDVSPQILGV